MPALRQWNTALMGGWTVNSLNMCGFAWQPANLEDLWLPAPNRVRNRTVPGIDGSVSYRPRKAERRVDIRLWMSGATNQAGTPHSDPTEGFATNVDTIVASVVDPPTAPNTTYASVLTMPDASVRNAGVQVLDFSYVAIGNNLARGVLALVIPAGEHT